MVAAPGSPLQPLDRIELPVVGHRLLVQLAVERIEPQVVGHRLLVVVQHTSVVVQRTAAEHIELQVVQLLAAAVVRRDFRRDSVVR